MILRQGVPDQPYRHGVKSFLRRLGLFTGMLKAPDAVARPSAQQGKPGPPAKKGSPSDRWLLVMVRVVLLLLLLGLVAESGSTFWRILGLVAFCGIALGLGAQLRALTGRESGRTRR